ncbi:MAG: hypothetical protein CMP10_20340 [Zetaproteobacteria bacterium]|nr:hypothetical protein [Pseudobdellovibrionaceae bacterium]
MKKLSLFILLLLMPSMGISATQWTVEIKFPDNLMTTHKPPKKGWWELPLGQDAPYKCRLQPINRKKELVSRAIFCNIGPHKFQQLTVCMKKGHLTHTSNIFFLDDTRTKKSWRISVICKPK